MEHSKEYIAIEQAKRCLMRILKKDRSVEFTAIADLVDKYLIDNCNHNIIEDLIDIDPDRSKNIKYCNLCYKTF